MGGGNKLWIYDILVFRQSIPERTQKYPELCYCCQFDNENVI